MRRIQRDICHDELIKNLTSGDAPIFKEIWRLMLFAAALGISREKRKPLAKTDTGKAIPETYFNTPGWRGFLYLLGVAESGDSQCLTGTDEAHDLLILAFEEFANSGLHLIAERLTISSVQLDEFVDLCLEVNSKKIAPANILNLI